MKKRNIVSLAGLMALAGVLSAFCVGCAGNAAAATVNGATIKESEVTEYIENIRSSYGFEDTDSWGQYLASCRMTPSDIRNDVIESLVSREIVKQEAENEGISVEQEEVDGYVDQMRAYYNTDEEWNQALKSAGLTEKEYREEIEKQLIEKALQDKVVGEVEVSDEDLLSYGNMYAQAYDGAKKSSHILFDASDKENAQKVLDRIKAGELDFAEAAEEYSIDEASAVKGGDLGWDTSSNFVAEFTAGLEPLEKGEVSGLVTSEFGIHIIKCTDVFTAPKEKGEDDAEVVKLSSIDQLPADLQETVLETVKESQKSNLYQTWLQEKRDAAEVTINDMPTKPKLSYDVDMSAYETDEAETAAALEE